MNDADDTASYEAFLMERCEYSNIVDSFYRQQDISLTSYGGVKGFVFTGDMRQDV